MTSQLIFSCLWALLLVTTFRPNHCYVFNYFEWRDLFGDVAGMQLDLPAWTITAVSGVTNKYTLCNTFPLLGGYGVIEPNAGTAARLYNQLPTHNMVYYSIYFYIFDYWNGTDYFSLKFDSTEVEFRQFAVDSTAFAPIVCGEVNRRGIEMFLVGKTPHSGPT